MVAGEYAVLVPNQHLVVTAVDRFIYVKIEKSKKNTLHLNDFQLYDMPWEFQNGKVYLDIKDDRTSFVQSAMDVAFTYLQEQGFTTCPISLSITSELDDESGAKYGLGSSAAIVTGVVTALLRAFLQQKPREEFIFKLAAIAHVKTQGSGSGADITASTYGGMLEYSSFQADWLLEQLQQTISITELVQKEWAYLHIRKLPFPKQWKMLVGWTGKPASTAKLVPEVLKYKQKNKKQFQTFLEKSAQAVKDILLGIKRESLEQFYKGIKDNHEALAEIGRLANVPIETSLLHKLKQIAEKYDSVGKLSGAGGGDCGIAFTTSLQNEKQIKSAWKATGIKPLQITMYPYGAKEGSLSNDVG